MNMKIGSISRNDTARRPLSLLAGCVVVVFMACSLSGGAQSGPDLLTAEERAWLQARGPLRYAPHVEAPPFEFFRPDGQVAGIVPELLAILAQWTGQPAAPPAWHMPDWVWQGALALLACLALFAVWNYSLRRRVAQQT
ncbi:MAG: hypothetical protein AAB466_03845 [Verrucomicrobiota bacterium]